MFKTDKESLERLSFEFTERDIANFRAILEHLKEGNLLTINRQEVQRAIKGLEAIGNLKLDGQIYGFYVDDSYAARNIGNGEGVELYLRQGDKLREYYVSGDRDYVFSENDAIEFLKANKKTIVYTGPISINTSFLGLPHECDEEDPVIRDVLRDGQIEEFEAGGIRVIKLEHLI
jgi:hypothetical protein